MYIYMYINIVIGSNWNASMLHFLGLPRFPNQKGTAGGLAELPWETPKGLRRTSALWFSTGMHKRIRTDMGHVGYI